MTMPSYTRTKRFCFQFPHDLCSSRNKLSVLIIHLPVHISSQHQTWPELTGKLPVLELSHIWDTALLFQTTRWQQNAQQLKPRKSGVFSLTTFALSFSFNLFSSFRNLYPLITQCYRNPHRFQTLSPTFCRPRFFLPNFQLCQLSDAPHSRFSHVPSRHREQVFRPLILTWTSLRSLIVSLFLFYISLPALFLPCQHRVNRSLILSSGGGQQTRERESANIPNHSLTHTHWHT